MLDGRAVGMIHHETYHGTEIFVLRINGNTDYSKAPTAVQENNSRLIDYLNHKSLPLGDPRTLANTLALELMRAIPEQYSNGLPNS
ncbi:hypothetical protein [Oceanisphaera profunda]|nr:hypothetical protein [Oceanisphaera profunda]